MQISELRELLAVLTEHGVKYYKCGDVELGLSESESASGDMSTNAIGFAAPTLTAEELEFEARLAELKRKLPPEYFDKRLGLVAGK